MVGNALVRRLKQEDCEIVTIDRRELDLTSQTEVNQWISHNDVNVIIVAAAKVGGISANSLYPAEFLHANLMIASNVIHAAWQHSVDKLLFLGSSCIYPKNASQPMREDALLTGPLEPTNEWYSIAKIAGINCVRLTGRNMIVILFQPCQQIYTVLEITFILKTAMCRPL